MIKFKIKSVDIVGNVYIDEVVSTFDIRIFICKGDRIEVGNENINLKDTFGIARQIEKIELIE